ncbi:sulfurtransferase [Amylibacter sp. SFDW26]|uniref:sulfurtransferase n=1 Tax=Amylibacter sp. SFDW26 TaxID=2652722 RepID=UPI001261650F|nr:sulfurtransferase [Amylibacter sp. SFDW26]KAB7615443.1 sulfurtransferase [Amylibacter sp. SFDW26]
MSNTSPLISADELNDLLGRSDVKVFDVRGTWSGTVEDAENAYNKGHIHGAVFLDWKTHFMEPDLAPNIAPVASQENATAAFAALGINPDDLVVLYDDYHHMMAGRIWWAMQYRGFTNVKILNGGWTHWQQKSFASSTDVPVPSKGTFVASENSDLIISLEDVIATKDASNLVDARGPVGYIGDPDDPKTGHIPGAVNLSFREVLDEASVLFKSDADIADVFNTQLSDFDDKPLITSCGSGYAATILLIALKQIGITAPLFDGSFAVWKQDDTRPIEQGA